MPNLEDRFEAAETLWNQGAQVDVCGVGQVGEEVTTIAVDSTVSGKQPRVEGAGDQRGEGARQGLIPT